MRQSRGEQGQLRLQPRLSRPVPGQRKRGVGEATAPYSPLSMDICLFRRNLGLGSTLSTGSPRGEPRKHNHGKFCVSFATLSQGRKISEECLTSSTKPVLWVAEVPPSA